MVELIAPMDAMFLVNESREHPMHVGALLLFEPPAGAGPEFARSAYRTLANAREFQPTFRKRPGKILGATTGLTWQCDDDVDLEYHLRRSALPSPGRVRELLELSSQLHSNLLDRHRPLWEMHLVEGLADGRYAAYLKVHHALVDGVSALRLLQRTMSTDPDATDLGVLWDQPRPESASIEQDDRSALGRFTRAVQGATAAGPSSVALVRAALNEQQRLLPFAAPRTMFNVPIGGARRVAAQSWSLARVKAVARSTGTTINDVVLAMCAAALRAYLEEQNALPDEPLVAMVPVSLRTRNEADKGGTIVGTILCNLATDLDDPAERLRTITSSMRKGKELFAQLPRAQALAVSALMISPLGLSNIPGFVSATRPPFNLVISNVPGPGEPAYWGGARLDGIYPLSIALDGQAVNITLASNADQLDFGIVGCRRSVPHLQRLLTHLETGLSELEHAAT